MSRDHAMAAILLMGLISGLFSPYRLIITLAMRALAPGLLLTSPPIVMLLSMLIFATLTIMLAGIPAALYERATGRQDSDLISHLIWLAAAVVLALPALTALALSILT
jgi:hypothetical protein